MSKKKVIVIGAGVAGMQAALSLKEWGAEPVILEREDAPGGKVAGWHKLFPTFTPVGEVLGPLLGELDRSGIEVRTGARVEALDADGVTLCGGEKLVADAIVVATGFELFDARIKEEYGYGIYDNVYTSVDLEKMFDAGRIVTRQGTEPKRVALLHCVGSRDEKVGAHHCSRVCCVTGVKQAIEIKKMIPTAEVYNFYMDIRMFGAGYEELYREAQMDYNIHFIRGRISEASQTMDSRVQIKAEDTLVGRPLKMSVDMLVLIIGMRGGNSNVDFARAGLKMSVSGFMQPVDPFMGNLLSGVDNVFYAGAVTAPKNIGESLNEGIAVAGKVAEYLKL